jgi:dTDP-4-dehydrorhamnose 3,5-epimerase
MKIIEIKALALPEVKVVRFARFGDARGYFTEVFRKSGFFGHPRLGFLEGVEFLQVNESLSKPGVIRGLHFQWNPSMGKLLRTVKGRMIDLALDIRKGSPSFGKIVACDMPSEPGRSYGEWIWVPPGFAHGNFFTEETVIEYFCSGEYSPGCEAGLSPLAKDIDWSLCDPGLRGLFSEIAARAVMSDKDRAGLSVAAWKADPRSEHFIFGKKPPELSAR